MVTPQDIEITNKEVLQRLDDLRDYFFEVEAKEGLRFLPDDNIQEYSSEKAKTDPEYFLSDEYLEYMIQKGKEGKHRGFPEEFFAWPIGRLAKANPAWKNLLEKVKDDFVYDYAASHSSLASYYEPKGFVGWHTNWNNSNYQILLTWSETGDSYFLYKDCQDGQVKRIQERPGWQAHLVYFGNTKETEHVFWHAAYTNCKRFAWALSWNNDKKGSSKDKEAQTLVNLCIEDLTYDD